MQLLGWRRQHNLTLRFPLRVTDRPQQVVKSVRLRNWKRESEPLLQILAPVRGRLSLVRHDGNLTTLAANCYSLRARAK